MALPTVKVKFDFDIKQAQINAELLKKKLQDIPNAAAAGAPKTKKLSDSIKNLGNVSGRTRSQMQNVSFQLQDIIVQIQGGQGAVRAFSQQLPQLAGGFGALGAAIGVGVALLVPALAMAYNALSAESETLEDRLDSLDDIIDSLGDKQKILSMSSQELADKYGLLSNRVRKFTEALAVDEMARASSKMQDQILSISEYVSEMTGAVFSVDDMGNVVEDSTRSISRMTSVMDISAGTAALLRDQFIAMNDPAASPQQQAAALENVLDILKDIGLDITVLPEELRTAVLHALELSNKMDAAAQAIKNATAEAVDLSAEMQAIAAIGGGRGSVNPSATDIFFMGQGGEFQESEEDKKSRTGTGTSKTNSKLDTLIKSLQDEREVVETFREEGMALLMSASEAELEALGGINEAKLRLEEEYQNKLRGIKAKSHETNLSMTLGAGATVLGALGSFNDKALKMSKVAGAAQALVSTLQGSAEALKLPFPMNMAAAAAVMAKGLALVGAIKGVSSGGGGGGGGAASSAVAAGPAQTPLDVRLSGLGPSDMISGNQLSDLFDKLQDEAGDRGLSVSFAS